MQYLCGHVFYFLIILLILMQVRPGLIAQSQQILGPNTLIQGALPEIFANTPQNFFDNTIRIIQVSQNVVNKISIIR